MAIQTINIKNFKGISAASHGLNGNSIFVLGSNAKGKTSLIDACFGNIPGKPLKEGARKGEVSIETEDYICEYKFTDRNQKAKLNIFDKSGQPQKAPATLFKELFGVNDFDIDKFLKESSKNQIEKIKGLVGIDWTDIDEDYEKYFEERRFLNRKLKDLEAKTDGTEHDPNLKHTDTSPLLKELKGANLHNEKVNKVKSGLETRCERKKEIEAEIEALQNKVREIESDIQKGEKWLESNNLINTEELTNSLEEVTAKNALCVANEENKKIRDEALDTFKKIEEIENILEGIKETKRAELSSAEMPVRGLTFDEDTLYLDGIPFKGDQINTARKIVAALEIQYALIDNNVPNKIARFDGSLLDKDSIDLVLKWAEDKGVQLFVELVDRDGGDLRVEIIED